MPTPCFVCNSWIAETSFIPPGISQSKCSEIVGLAPVRTFTCDASENFSSIVVAAPACTNFPNLVPVLAKPHDGSSIRKPSRALQIFSVSSPVLFVPSDAIANPLNSRFFYFGNILSIETSQRLHHLHRNCQRILDYPRRLFHHNHI